MSDVVIKVEHVSKHYRIGEVSTGNLSHDLIKWWHELRGKENPFLKLGEENDRTKKSQNDYVWAVQDVSFQLRQGEVLGIIGRNGAGKSTLLKILSRTTAPTTGTLKLKGRLASLLEVGTGFHPELSGRDNIFLNGAILGMQKHEIKKKFDEIVDFSGVERYIDTPVKRYSSGMYVRLAFAVAAHLESEILIVDEVLAVGDAEFQRKCLGVMKDVSAKNGRTVLFVSHNLLAVKSLCTTGILMENGKVTSSGHIDNVIFKYTSIANQNIGSFVSVEKESSGFTVHSISVSDNGITGHFDIEEDLVFEIRVTGHREFEAININLFFVTPDDSVVFATCSASEKVTPGIYCFFCTIPANTLNDIIYTIDLMVVETGPKILHHLKSLLSVEGTEQRREGAWLGKFPGLLRPVNFKWTKMEIHGIL
jgi:lipopolysaccharide transport system ATP-binding protein